VKNARFVGVDNPKHDDAYGYDPHQKGRMAFLLGGAPDRFFCSVQLNRKAPADFDSASMALMLRP
jgi:hypothetical protein